MFPYSLVILAHLKLLAFLAGNISGQQIIILLKISLMAKTMWEATWWVNTEKTYWPQLKKTTKLGTCFQKPDWKCQFKLQSGDAMKRGQTCHHSHFAPGWESSCFQEKIRGTYNTPVSGLHHQYDWPENSMGSPLTWSLVIYKSDLVLRTTFLPVTREQCYFAFVMSCLKKKIKWEWEK